LVIEGFAGVTAIDTSVAGVTEPLKVTMAGELVALLATKTLPVTLPVAVGANDTLSVTDRPGVRAVLAPTPLALNPAPELVILEIVTFEFPVFVTVMFCELLLPTLTFPKLRLVGLTPRVRVAATPEPLRLTDVGEVGALLTIEMFPITLAVAAGVNTALNVALFPTGIVTGVARPLTLNPLPAMLA
jgi:hypothetical protein